MRDFTVRTNTLPEYFRKYEDVVSMKFAVWQQIKTKIRDCQKAGIIREDLDTTIVEINFGVKSFEIFNELKSINEQCAVIELYNIKLD